MTVLRLTTSMIATDTGSHREWIPGGVWEQAGMGSTGTNGPTSKPTTTESDTV